MGVGEGMRTTVAASRTPTSIPQRRGISLSFARHWAALITEMGRSERWGVRRGDDSQEGVLRLQGVKDRWSLVATERLRLRRVTRADVAALVAISTDPRTNEHRPQGAPSRAQSEEIIAGFMSDWEQHGVGYWVVEYLGEVVGVAGVRSSILCGRECWNLYYRFSPHAWGKGLAAEAASAAIAVARECDATRPILARTRPDNLAAARLAQRIGMTRRAEWDGDGLVAFVAAGPTA